MNYAKLLEISSFFTWHIFLEVGKTQDMPSKIWQTLGDALTCGLRNTFMLQQSKMKKYTAPARTMEKSKYAYQ